MRIDPIGVAMPEPQGVLVVGGHPWATGLAAAIRAQGLSVLVVDTNADRIEAARMMGLPAFNGSILSSQAQERVEQGGIGQLLALTPNDEANSLAALHFAGVLGHARVYQLSPAHREQSRMQVVRAGLGGRILFGKDATFEHLSQLYREGARIKSTPITEQLTYASFQRKYGSSALPLAAVDRAGNLTVFTADLLTAPKPGHTLISLVNETQQPAFHSPEEQQDLGHRNGNSTSGDAQDASLSAELSGAS
jgi:hypothetical protein